MDIMGILGYVLRLLAPHHQRMSYLPNVPYSCLGKNYGLEWVDMAIWRQYMLEIVQE
jgi:hypothetical protein